MLALLNSNAVAAEPELRIGKFSSGDLTGWKDQTYFSSKKTAYTLVQDNGKPVLMGKAVNSASGKLYKIEIDPKSYPIIKWSWKIEKTIKKANEKTKEGNDFAARLYVVFPRGLFSSTRAIEYVWGNTMLKGEVSRSPNTNNFAMIAVDSGDEQAGNWIFHKRNFAEDYRKIFGEEAPKVGAIALMCDSDNTHETAVGYFGDITIAPTSKEEDIRIKEPKPKESLPKEPQKELIQKEQPNPVSTVPAAPGLPQNP
jgi:hypothetical protein